MPRLEPSFLTRAQLCSLLTAACWNPVRGRVTEVRRAKVFYPAEKYHQRKLQKGGQSAEKECTVAVRCYG